MEIRRLEEQGMTRNVLVQRNTKETKITMSLNLDGTGKASLNTGIGFFDHMLDGFARHGFFDLDLAVDGDLNVDSHHTIEDTGIVLGTAIKEALGDKAGIRRYGSMILPMDETLVLCGIDLSGLKGRVDVTVGRSFRHCTQQADHVDHDLRILHADGLAL